MWGLETTLANLPPWWQRIDNNPDWQDGAFIGLAACYGLIALVAVVQLIRIQKRVPEYGWTTQKVYPTSVNKCTQVQSMGIKSMTIAMASCPCGSCLSTLCFLHGTPTHPGDKFCIINLAEFIDSLLETNAAGFVCAYVLKRNADIRAVFFSTLCCSFDWLS